MTAPKNPEALGAIAQAVIRGWENLEGESMRDGHRFTLVRLIVAALERVQKAGEEQIARRKWEVADERSTSEELRVPFNAWIEAQVAQGVKAAEQGSHVVLQAPGGEDAACIRCLRFSPNWPQGCQELQAQKRQQDYTKFTAEITQLRAENAKLKAEAAERSKP